MQYCTELVTMKGYYRTVIQKHIDSEKSTPRKPLTGTIS